MTIHLYQGCFCRQHNDCFLEQYGYINIHHKHVYISHLNRKLHLRRYCLHVVVSVWLVLRLSCFDVGILLQRKPIQTIEILCRSLVIYLLPVTILTVSDNIYCQWHYLLPVTIFTASDNIYYQWQYLLPVTIFTASDNIYCQWQYLLPVTIFNDHI